MVQRPYQFFGHTGPFLASWVAACSRQIYCSSDVPSRMHAVRTMCWSGARITGAASLRQLLQRDSNPSLFEQALLSLLKTLSTRGGKLDGLGWMAMISFLGLLLHVLALPFRSRASLEAEIVFLRHQLNVLKGQAPTRPRLSMADRWLFVRLYRWMPSLLHAAVIVKPDTIVRCVYTLECSTAASFVKALPATISDINSLSNSRGMFCSVGHRPSRNQRLSGSTIGFSLNISANRR
jgi:hypothetical protein